MGVMSVGEGEAVKEERERERDEMYQTMMVVAGLQPGLMGWRVIIGVPIRPFLVVFCHLNLPFF